MKGLIQQTANAFKSKTKYLSFTFEPLDDGEDLAGGRADPDIVLDTILLVVVGMIGMIIPMATGSHPKAPRYRDEIIPMDGGWLPHWDEALDEPTGIIQAVYFVSYLSYLQNTQPRLSQLIRPKLIPMGQPISIHWDNLIHMARSLGVRCIPTTKKKLFAFIQLPVGCARSFIRVCGDRGTATAPN